MSLRHYCPYVKWASLRSRVLVKSIFTVFEVKSTSLQSRALVKSTIYRYWSKINIFELTRWRKFDILLFVFFKIEINIFAVTRSREINILTVFGVKSTFLSRISWNQHFAVLKYKKSTSLPSRVNVKSTYKLFLTWNQHFWTYALCEINILLFSKWNQRPWGRALTWNQHFNCFWPESEINIFELARCVKSTFCCILCEINIFTIARWCDNKYESFKYVISRKRSKHPRKNTGHCLTHLNKTTRKIWSVFDRVRFWPTIPNALFSSSPLIISLQWKVQKLRL